MDDGVVQAALSRKTLERAAGYLGIVLCVVAAGLLLRRGFALRAALGEQFHRISAAAFAEAFALYLAGAIGLAGTWVALARLAASAPVQTRPLIVAHLRAQLAKYLPGNVFHFAYRHIAARREGIGHAALGRALALESLLLITAAALLAIGVVSDPRLQSAMPWTHDIVFAVPLGAALVAIAVVVGGRRWGFAHASRRAIATTLLGVLVVDFVFFLLAGCALRALCTQPAALPLAAWWGWLGLAWIVGYVTPGAPAGLGLREAVIVLGIGPIVGEAEALALALAYRLVTVGVDALLAAVGFAVGRGSTETPRAGID